MTFAYLDLDCFQSIAWVGLLWALSAAYVLLMAIIGPVLARIMNELRSFRSSNHSSEFRKSSIKASQKFPCPGISWGEEHRSCH